MAMVPGEGLLATVRDYAATAIGCSPDRVTAVRRFEDGNRHAVYKVSYLDPGGATAAVVVRASYGGDPVEREQAEREAAVLEKAGGVAAPLLYDFRVASPWFETPTMCMQFVPGRQTELTSATPPMIERLGSVVGWLHRLPVDDVVDGPSTPGDIASYAQGRLRSIIATSVWARDPLPAAIQARLRRVGGSVQRSFEACRGAESFSAGEPLALLHGDIGPGNILWGPDPVLIDWEYARLGDPADEIAYTFDQNGLTAAQREAFWRGYRDGVTSQSQLAHVTDRVDWWEPLTLLGSTLWWVERWVRRTEAEAAGEVDPAAPRESAYYFDQVIRRLDRLENLLA